MTEPSKEDLKPTQAERELALKIAREEGNYFESAKDMADCLAHNFAKIRVQQRQSWEREKEELERALRIASNEPEERTQESAHYIWLDDQNEKLKSEKSALKKEKAELEERVRVLELELKKCNGQ